MERLSISIADMPIVEINRKNTPKVSIDSLKSDIATDHNALENLSYDNCGHTGFQKELTQEQLQSIDMIPQIDAVLVENTNNLEQEVLARKEGERALTAMASEALSVAKGANQALAYDSYEDMYNSFVSLCSTIDGKNKYPVGNNVFIKTLNVPDLWISAIRDDVAFDCIAPDGSFCGDDGFVSLLKNEGECQIGYYVFSPLETQKVDLSEYATIDYVDNALGRIEVALDNIIAVQNELIGGESV